MVEAQYEEIKDVNPKDQKLTIMIEHCVDCRTHDWNTNHIEGKYKDKCATLKEAILSLLPEAEILVNQIYRDWEPLNTYQQLIPNDDEMYPYFDISPRLGAFEVSTVINNQDILFYSKFKSQLWPHNTNLAKLIKRFWGDYTSGELNPRQLWRTYETKPAKVQQRNREIIAYKKKQRTKSAGMKRPAAKKSMPIM